MKRHSDSSRLEADGGIQLPGALMRDAILPRNSNSVAAVSSSLRRINSGGESCQPFIDYREFATGFFLGCFVALVAVLFCIGFVGYRALIA